MLVSIDIRNLLSCRASSISATPTSKIRLLWDPCRSRHREPGVPPLPSSAGQISTGPAIVNQLDSFLPPCPIISRYNVIPTGYEKRLHSYSSHHTLVDQAVPPMRTLFTRRGLRRRKPFHRKRQKILAAAINTAVSGCYSDLSQLVTQRLRRSSGNRRFRGVTTAMPFLT